MSSTQVTVTVLESGEVYTELPHARPVRRLPDGRPGVVYRGVVFPLHPGNKIELNDDTSEKDDCPFAEEPIWPTPSSGEIPFRWYIEHNKFGNYLVFDGPEDRCDEILEALDDEEIPWVRADRSSRPADDGHQYDWFIRLEDDRPKADVQPEIEDLLIGLYGESDETEEEIEEESSIEELEEALEKLQKKHQKELQKETDFHSLEVFALKRDKKELAEKLEDAYRSNHDLNALLKGKFAEDISTERASLDLQLKEHEREITRLREEASVLAREKDDLESTVLEKEDLLQHYENRITSLEERLKKRPAGRRKDLINQLDGILSAFFKSIRFDDLSFRTISENFSNWTTLIRLLSALDTNQLSKRKRVQGTKSWWEIEKVATGSGNQGRIYFKATKEQGKNRYDVWVRLKKSQELDFDRMRDFD